MSRRLGAFSLIELLLVVVLTSILAAVATPPILNQYRTTVVDSELKSLVTSLRRARQLAISNDSSSSYSVKFFEGRYVLFMGSSYTEGANGNREFQLESNVIAESTFPQDIVSFQNFTGRTSAAGSVILLAFGHQRTVTINTLGIVTSID